MEDQICDQCEKPILAIHPRSRVGRDLMHTECYLAWRDGIRPSRQISLWQKFSIFLVGLLQAKKVARGS